MSDISKQIAKLADSLEKVQALQVVISSREPVAMVNEQGREWIVAGLRKLAAAMRSGDAIAAAADWLMQDDSAYEAQPAAARRAAKGMLDAADSADGRVPYATQNVMCDDCGYSWIAIAPVMTVGPFECPSCRKMAGELCDRTKTPSEERTINAPHDQRREAHHAQHNSLNRACA